MMTTIRADRVGFPKGEVDVYLIHLSPRYKGAGHYIGSTERRVGERFAEHLNGGGGMRAVRRPGVARGEPGRRVPGQVAGGGPEPLPALQPGRLAQACRRRSIWTF